MLNSRFATNQVHDHIQLITAEQLGGILGVSVRTVWRLRSAGKLPLPVQLGGSIRWKRGEVEAWIDANCPNLENWLSS